MSSPELPDKVASPASTDSFSVSRFFEAAYDKGVIQTVREHPKDALAAAGSLVAGVAGTIAACSAALYLSRGRAAEGLMASALQQESKAGLTAAGEKLLAAGSGARSTEAILENRPAVNLTSTYYGVATDQVPMRFDNVAKTLRELGSARNIGAVHPGSGFTVTETPGTASIEPMVSSSTEALQNRWRRILGDPDFSINTVRMTKNDLVFDPMKALLNDSAKQTESLPKAWSQIDVRELMKGRPLASGDNIRSEATANWKDLIGPGPEDLRALLKSLRPEH